MLTVFGVVAHGHIGVTKLPSKLENMLINGMILPESTFSEESLGQAQKWLLECQSEHQQCHATTARLGVMPTRLLHVSVTKTAYTVRLVEPGADVPYLCLSHCWGHGEPPFKTTKNNLSANKRAIFWSDLPKTFQHALEFTHRLGFDNL